MTCSAVLDFHFNVVAARPWDEDGEKRKIMKDDLS